MSSSEGEAEIANELLDTFLIAGWSYNRSRQILDRMSIDARTRKLKGEWFDKSGGVVDISKAAAGEPSIDDHARLMTDCLLKWGHSYNTAVSVIDFAKIFAAQRHANGMWINTTGFVIREDAPNG